MIENCWLCGGSGGIYKNYQCMKCPICTETEPVKAGWHEEYFPILCAKHFGPEFKKPPWLLVIHSGSKGANIAEYFHNVADGRQVSTHLAWSSKFGTYVQCVALDHVAWHVGGSTYRKQRKLNFCSIGIEMTGPWNKQRDDREHDLLRRNVKHILTLVPSLNTVVCHKDINKRKKDPGNFDVHCLDGLGLDMPFS